MNHPIKQCNLQVVHTGPHGWLDTSTDQTYSRCDGVTPMTAANNNWLRLNPMTLVAADALYKVHQDIKQQIIISAVEQGARVGDRLTVQVESAAEDGKAATFRCEVDSDGNLSLASVHDVTPTQMMSMGVAPGAIALAEQADVNMYPYTRDAADDQLTSEQTPDTMPDALRRIVPSQSARVAMAIEAGRTDLTDQVPVDSDLWHILYELLPEIDAHLRIAGEHYGYETHRDLGLRGQYADLYRKFVVLRRVMWDGEDTTRESLREILRDLVGHALLTIAMIDLPKGK